MQKLNIKILAAVFVAGGVSSVHANPIVPDLYGMSGDGALWGLIATSAILIEYLVVRWLLNPWVKFRHVLPAFLIINLVTFPFTQFLGFMFVWLAEILPLAIEPPMYKWYFRRVGVEVPGLRAKIIGANLASFVVGVVMYHVIVIVKGA